MLLKIAATLTFIIKESVSCNKFMLYYLFNYKIRFFMLNVGIQINIMHFDTIIYNPNNNLFPEDTGVFGLVLV